MKLAAFAFLGALLAAGAVAQLPPPYNKPAYGPVPPANTKKLTNSLVINSMIQSLVNAPGQLLSGKVLVRRPGKASEKREVDPGCLNTVVPEPLNWGPLWCGGPGKQAKVLEWTDEVGSVHRSVSIPVQPKVTSAMVIWLFSPLYPQNLEYAGKQWYWYHLWHPMDHIQAGTIALPSSANPTKPAFYALIHEHYRNTPEEKAAGLNEWETDNWFHVEDFFSNMLKKRVVITVNAMGLQAWTLIVNLKDTPEGLKIDVEQIMGAAPVGYDKAEPARGSPREVAQLMNDNVVKSSLSAYAEWGSPEFAHSANAITRHVVEEFSMFRFFLPEIWARYPMMQQMATASEGILSRIPKFNYGFNMFAKAPNMAGLTDVLTPLNGTALTNHTAVVNAVTQVPQALVSGVSANLGATVSFYNKNGELVTAALSSGDASKVVHTAVELAVPSAAAEFATGN